MPSKNSKLSAREHQILSMIAFEHTTQEIAKQLFLSPETIKSYRKILLQKMNARNVAGLVRRAMERDLVQV